MAFRSLDRPPPDVPPEGLDLDAALTAAGVGTPGGPRALLVRKRRTRYTVAGCLAEVAVLEVEGRRTTSIAVESTDPSAVLATVEALGLSAHVNHDVPTGLRMLVDHVPERYAVIDAGTNSTKFHVAEIDPDSGAWRTVVDRAVVTRLGEGLEAIRRDRRRAARPDRAGHQRDGRRGAPPRRARHRRGRHGRPAHREQPGRCRRARAGPVGRRARGDLGRGRGSARPSRRGDGDRARRRADRRLRHRRRELAVHLRPRGGRRRAVQPERRRGPVHRAVRVDARGLGRGRRRGRRRDRGRARPPRRATTTARCRRHGWCRDEPGGRAARPDHLRPGGHPGHRPGPRRDRPSDRAVPRPGRRRGAGRSPACSRHAPRSSSPARASSGPSSTSSGADAVTVSDRGLRHGVLHERFGPSGSGRRLLS